MKQYIPSDVYQRLLDMPCFPSAPKRWAITKAMRDYHLESWQIEELKEQWAWAAPQVSFPE